MISTLCNPRQTLWDTSLSFQQMMAVLASLPYPTPDRKLISICPSAPHIFKFVWGGGGGGQGDRRFAKLYDHLSMQPDLMPAILLNVNEVFPSLQFI